MTRDVNENDDSFRKPPSFRWIAFVSFICAIPVSLVFGYLPIGLVYYSYSEQPRWPEIDRYWFEWLAAAGTIGDAFGLANATLSGTAMIIAFYAIYCQMQEFRASQISMRKTADDANDDAVFVMHQEFTHKQEQRKAAWNVLSRFLKSENYRRFVIETCDPALFHDYRFTPELWLEFQGDFHPRPEYDSYELTQELDSRERHDFNDVLNFFNVLALRKAHDTTFQRCNFYYDWWGPPIWFYALHIEFYRLHVASPEFREQMLERHWIAMLVRLDEIFGACTTEELNKRKELYSCEDLDRRKLLLREVMTNIVEVPIVRQHVDGITDAYDQLATKLLKHFKSGTEYLVPGDTCERVALSKRLQFLVEYEFLTAFEIENLEPGVNLIDMASITQKGIEFLREKKVRDKQMSSVESILECLLS